MFEIVPRGLGNDTCKSERKFMFNYLNIHTGK